MILKSLKSLTQDKTGSCFCDPSFDGEKTAVMFTTSGQVIGEVTYLWVPTLEVNN